MPDTLPTSMPTGTPTTAKTAPKIQTAAAWRQVADYLRQQIIDGEYAPGQQLPPELALSQEFGVARPTINKALHLLMSEGLVTVTRQRGTIVRDPFAAPEHTDTRTLTTPAGPEAPFTTPGGPRWTDLGEPSLISQDATATHAELLDQPMPAPLLVRESLQTAQSGELRRAVRLMVPYRIAADYKTPWQGPIPDSGEVFAWFQHHGHPLAFTDHIRARVPLGDESTSLNTPPGTPLLVITRVAATGGTPVAAEQVTASAAALSYAYPVTVTPARKASRRR
jgi:GntR family transcriptional regulator